MKFLLDEGVPFRLAAYLQGQGHDVAAVGRDHPHALAGRDVLAIARAEQRIIITNDKDFGDLVFRDRLPHTGVILFRLGYLPITVRIAHLRRVLTDYADRLDRLIVVTPRGIRVGAPQPEGRKEP